MSKITVPEEIKDSKSSTVEEMDVLWGRGKLQSTQPGNKKFREIINRSRIIYGDERQTKAGRAVIVRSIIDCIHSVGGKFLKWNKADQFWMEMTDKQKRDKIAHAIRDANKLADEKKKIRNASDLGVVYLRRNQSQTVQDNKNNACDGQHPPIGLSVSQRTYLECFVDQEMTDPIHFLPYHSSQFMTSMHGVNIESNWIVSNIESDANIVDVNAAQLSYNRNEPSVILNQFYGDAQFSNAAKSIECSNNTAASYRTMNYDLNHRLETSNVHINTTSIAEQRTQSLQDQVMAESSQSFSLESENDIFIKIIEWTLGDFDDSLEYYCPDSESRY